MRGRILAAAASCVLAGAAPALAQTVPTSREAPPPKWGPHIDLEGKLGNQRNLGEADLFVPLWQNGTTLAFGNVKTRIDDSTSMEGNFGLGLRHMLESGWNLGAYGYFDRRKATFGSYFNQVTLGAEALSVDWDIRANTYLPEGRRSHLVDSLNTATLEGTTVVFRGGEERSLTGFDGEIGWRVPVFDLDAGRTLRVYGGAYRFYGEGVDPVQGPRVRTELTFDEIPELWEGARLTLGAELQHDGPRGTNGFASLRLRIPLQAFGSGMPAARLTPIERRMTDPVIRDIDVVTQSGDFGAPETATQTASGDTLAVVSSGATNGQAAIQTALTNAGANSTVIMSGTFATTASVTLQSGQTLMGNGSVAVRSPSGRVALLTTATGASLTGTDVGAATSTLNMAANSTLMGLTIRDTESNGAANSIAVQVTGVSGVRIINSTLSSTATAAGSVSQALIITGAGASNVTVSGSTLTANGTTTVTNALNFTNGASGSITGNTMTATASGAATATALSLGNLGTTTATVSSNTLAASTSGGTAQVVSYSGTVNVNAGSTGNVNNGGVCNGAATSGLISFTAGTTCP